MPILKKNDLSIYSLRYKKKRNLINRHHQNSSDERSWNKEFTLRILQRSYIPALNSFQWDCSWSYRETLVEMLILGHYLAKLRISGPGLLTHWNTGFCRSVVTLQRLIGLLTRDGIFTELCLRSHLCFKFSFDIFPWVWNPAMLKLTLQFLICNLQLSVPGKHTKMTLDSASHQETCW